MISTRTAAVVLSAILPIILTLSQTACAQKTDSFASARRQMIERDLKKRDITDMSVLKAMNAVPRHRFVPYTLQAQAYADRPLPIGHGQTISQPYIVAFMTQMLKVQTEDRVLEIGTGCGYQAAVLSQLADKVYTIEIVEPLARKAQKLLAELDYKNIFVKAGDGYDGWSEKAPFDKIIVTCAPDDIPPALIDQLAEGGRIIAPVGPSGYAQYLVLATKSNGKLTHKKVLPVRFVPMTGKALEKAP